MKLNRKQKKVKRKNLINSIEKDGYKKKVWPKKLTRKERRASK